MGDKHRLSQYLPSAEMPAGSQPAPEGQVLGESAIQKLVKFPNGETGIVDKKTGKRVGE